MKAKLNYTVRTTRAPGEATSTIVPVIVERLSPTSLADVVSRRPPKALPTALPVRLPVSFRSVAASSSATTSTVARTSPARSRPTAG